MENSKQKRRGVPVILGICLFLVIGAIAGYFYVRTTPYYSLYMLKRAIINRDATNVLKYLDTDSILDNMAKDLTANMDKKEPARNKFQEHMQIAGQDVVKQLLPQMKRQARESLTVLLQSYDNENLFGDLRNFPILALSADIKGNTADIRMRGKDKVSFTMAKAAQGYWRITSLNPDEFKMLK